MDWYDCEVACGVALWIVGLSLLVFVFVLYCFGCFVLFGDLSETGEFRFLCVSLMLFNLFWFERLIFVYF